MQKFVNIIEMLTGMPNVSSLVTLGMPMPNNV
jgi:hypothetical protein